METFQNCFNSARFRIEVSLVLFDDVYTDFNLNLFLELDVMVIKMVIQIMEMGQVIPRK